ncbi:putative membrane protein [Streptosporangium becharense]|uniref:Putative membrane protein n=1 Tax=Streptosporangium becharense TaxID=1816182 RepID=A0A7W9MII8_9ACTN|nr:phage holin family protein [Streptosporangium becharense]MBB2911364.1 putative membrane protein [Streptosporangium becharense]MBB5821578.1 putative membrane protein [Streptosporangium becharense]
MKIIVKILAVAAALWAATKLVDGIIVSADTPAKEIGTLLAVALVFGVVNAVLKPIIKTLGCAFYILTLGLFALVVNAGLLLLTSWIAGQLDLAFHVAGFWAALWGAIVIGVISWLLDLVLGD